MRYVTLLAIGLFLAPTSLPAQDAHYWSFQYGPRSSLLGGAVIGSVGDVSGTFYNPGALPLARNLSFAVSANVFEKTGVALRGGGGEGVDIGESRTGLRPSLVAGTIGRNLFANDVLAYSILTRSKGTQDLQGYTILTGGDIPPSLSLDEFVGMVQFTGEFSDTWVGLSYGLGLGQHVGIGLTWYGAVRSQSRRGETISQSIATDGTGLMTLDIAGGSFSTIRTLAKVGTFFAGGPFTGGLTLTTPSLHIAGSGELNFNRAVFGTDTSSIAANIQPDLDATFKSPLSVGGGAAIRIGNGRLHASAEWFDEIPPYFVMQGEDFVGQEPPATFTVDAVQALDQVFNWGAGVEYGFTPGLIGYVSYYLDSSGFTDKVERAALSVLPMDINTVTAGAEFRVGIARFTLGAGYGWGSKVDQELTNVLADNDQDFEATFVFRSIRLIFGFEIGGGGR